MSSDRAQAMQDNFLTMVQFKSGKDIKQIFISIRLKFKIVPLFLNVVVKMLLSSVTFTLCYFCIIRFLVRMVMSVLPFSQIETIRRKSYQQVLLFAHLRANCLFIM